MLVRAFRDCEGDNIVVKVRKRYKVSTRPHATLLLSPRVKIVLSLFRLSTPQLTLSRVLVAVFGVCGNGDYGVCYVSQHEKISTRAPRFRVAYQAPHAVDGEGSHAVAVDQQVRACTAAAAHRARRRGPGPPRTAQRVPHAGGEKKLQSFNASSRDSPALP
jgi:hypothetical protein